MSAFNDLFNETSFTGQFITATDLTVSSSLTLPAVAPSSLLATSAASVLTSFPLSVGSFPYYSSTGLRAATFAGANGMTITETAGVITFNHGQDIRTSASPTFTGLTLGNITLAPVVAASPRTYTLPDVANADFVMTQGAQTLAGQKTFTLAPVLSSTTATSLLAVDAANALQSVILANANGCNASFSGSTLQFSMTQNLQSSALPTFYSVTLNRLYGGGLVCSNDGKTLVTCGYSNTNGCNVGFTAGSALGLLAFSMTQDLDVTGSPTFTGLTASGLTASSLLASSGTKALQSVGLANSNGCNATFAGSTLTFSMLQNLAASGTPAFASATLSAISNQLILSGSTVNDAQSSALGPARVITIPASGASTAEFVMTESASTINGIKTFSSAPVLTAMTASTLLSVDATKKVQSTVLTNFNGCQFTFTGSTLQCSLAQNITTAGTPSFASVTLATSGGTAAALNYYERYTHTTSWNGAYGAGSVAGNVQVTRIGQIVTVTFPVILGVCTANDPLWMMTNMPARFLPATDQYIPLGIVQTAAGATNSNGIAYISAGGNFQIHNGVGQSFSNVGSPTVGLSRATSVTYSI